MKKLLVVFFALSLVLAFTMPAMATDVEVSGSYYVRGWYDANSSLNEESTPNALYQQRFRISAIFKVARGLKLTTRMDAMEITWGEAPTGGNHANGYTNEATSWSVEMTKLDFATKFGLISAGIWDTNTWGLDFGNNSYTVGAINLMAPVGKFLLVAKIEKAIEKDAKIINGDKYDDNDQDNYIAAVVYRTPSLTAGLLYKYIRNAANRDLSPTLGFPSGMLVTIDVLSPYFKWKAGDLYAEGQLYWLKGDYTKEDGAFYPAGDTEVEGLDWYVMAKYKIAAFTVGGLVAYAQGDDPNTTKTNEGGLSAGWDWNPCLILWNDDFNYKAGGALGHVAGSTTNGEMSNAWIYQVFAEATPMDKLSVKTSYSYAKADEKPTGFVDTDYGTELDISANYKIYDNLDYMVGFGYFWAGDYYKGTGAAEKIDDTYLLVNKLTLSF